MTFEKTETFVTRIVAAAPPPPAPTPAPRLLAATESAMLMVALLEVAITWKPDAELPVASLDRTETRLPSLAVTPFIALLEKCELEMFTCTSPAEPPAEPTILSPSS